jgi:hypothetical protein
MDEGARTRKLGKELYATFLKRWDTRQQLLKEQIIYFFRLQLLLHTSFAGKIRSTINPAIGTWLCSQTNLTICVIESMKILSSNSLSLSLSNNEEPRRLTEYVADGKSVARLHYGIDYLDTLYDLVVKELERSAGQAYQLLSRYAKMERMLHHSVCCVARARARMCVNPTSRCSNRAATA